MTDSASETRAPRRALRTLWRLTLAVMVAAVLVVLAAGGAGYLAYRHITEPAVGGDAIDVEIPQGYSGAEIAKLLEEEGLVEHELFFRAAMKLEDNPQNVQHGVYAIPRGLSPVQILHVLYEGPVLPAGHDAFRLTVPEGLTIRQTADLLENPEAFLAAAQDEALRDLLGVTRADLEGFLMPDTYYFAEMPEEREIVARMVEEFEKTFAEIVEDYPEAGEADRNYIVTIASLVEEEARSDEERPLIASVIYNRLERNMPLDLDCTLQYALNKYGQRLLNEDKEVDSPYNTYRNAGLPPGPISNPGEASIRAALDPADTEYLFFVSNADGKTHTFSKTLSEHNAAVARYRKEIREQRRALQEAQ